MHIKTKKSLLNERGCGGAIKATILFPTFLLYLISAFSAHAQPSKFKPAENPDKLKQELIKSTKQLQSIKCDFVQEKNLSFMSEKIMAYGTLRYKKPEKVRMEYSKPFQYLMILNNGMIYIKDAGKVNQFNARSNKMFRQINDILLQSMDGSISENKDYKVNYFESDSQIMIELMPLGKDLKSMIQAIRLIMDKKDYGVVRFEMTETAGDYLHINFSNKELNATLADEVFSTK